jgi:hypothetical protein
MAQPVLVRSYTSPKRTPFGSPSGRSHALPPIAAFSFADILRAADSTDFQSAIDGIAEICAKNRLSLAEEYGSHLPPVGEITAVTTEIISVRQQHGRFGMRRALTSVPEASSGSSDGSAKGAKKGMLGVEPSSQSMKSPLRVIRISSAGRTIPICGTTAMSFGVSEDGAVQVPTLPRCSNISRPQQAMPSSSSRAVSSLQRLMGASKVPSA